MVTTGPLVRRARWDPGEGWKWIGAALSRLPRWAVEDDVWAADLARIGDRWVLYTLAPPDPPFVAGPPGRPAHRVLYGARLRFVHDVLGVVRYLTH